MATECDPDGSSASRQNLQLVVYETIADHRTASYQLTGRLCDPLSSLDYDLRRHAPGGGAALDLLEHLDRDLAIDFGVRAVRLGGDHRHAGIRFLANRHVQRDFAEERAALA